MLEGLNRSYFHWTGRSAQLLAQGTNGWSFEQGAHRQLAIQGAVYRGDHPHRGKRIPAEVEERVVDPDALQPETGRRYLGDDLLGRGLRRPEGCGGKYRCGQGLRSILPEEVNGNSSSTTICAGTM